jgi:hypothetical protein
MRLKDFIKQTLLDITQGVEQAQGEASVWIAPGRVMGKEQLEPLFVSFETAVTISKDGAANIEILMRRRISRKNKRKNSSNNLSTASNPLPLSPLPLCIQR